MVGFTGKDFQEKIRHSWGLSPGEARKTYSRLRPEFLYLLEKSADILERERIFVESNTHYPDRYRGNWARSVWNKLASRDICISVTSDAYDIGRAGGAGDAMPFIEENNLSEKVWLPKRRQWGVAMEGGFRKKPLSNPETYFLASNLPAQFENIKNV